MRTVVFVVLCVLLWALPVTAKIVYVDKYGVGGACSNDRGNPGTNPASPVCTCGAGTSRLARGDTMYIRAGTYAWNSPDFCYWSAQGIPAYGVPPLIIPSGGGSWASATVIAAYPGEHVILNGGGAGLGYATPAESWIIFDRLHLADGKLDVTSPDSTPPYCENPAPAHHIRFQNGSVYSTPGFSGGIMFLGGCGHHFEVLNNDLYNAGGGTAGHGCTDPYGCYTMYWSGNHSIFDGNRVFDNASYGFHIYASGLDNVSDNVVSNNIFYNNGFYDLRSLNNYGGGAAMVVGSGARNKVFNNLVFGNWAGIEIGYRCHNCEVYNNTVYSNEQHGIAIDTSSNHVIVRNNISYNNGRDISNSGPSTTLGPNWESANGDPQFVK